MPLSLTSRMRELIDYFESYSAHLKKSDMLLDIFEGNLRPYVEEALKKELSTEKSFEQAKSRIPPINLLTKYIDKLSTIYGAAPKRLIVDGNDSDQELLDWYLESMEFDYNMNTANEFYNLFKNVFVWPYVNMGKPKLRILPASKYVVKSDDPKDPLRPTVFMMLKGTDESGHKVFVAFTEYEFLIFNSDEKVLTREMDALGNPEGVNELGQLPGEYIKKSKSFLIPPHDSDTLSMTVLTPLLLADLNFISKFTAFPIRYGIGVEDKTMVYSPNAFWSFQSTSDGEVTPEVGTLDSSADVTQMLRSIESQIALWLTTRGIKPGSVGSLDLDQAESGIAKMIDEMDTTEHRVKQVGVFGSAEKALWDFILHRLHPFWVDNGLVDANQKFSETARVDVDFQPQIPAVRRGDIVRDIKEEFQAGFISRKRAIQKLNPRMSEQEVEELILEIDAGRTIEVPDDTEDDNEE